jgi:hypothetical protein
MSAMRKVTRARARSGQTQIRNAVVAAGYGSRVKNVVRYYSKDIKDGVEARIVSRGKYRRPSGVIDLIAIFQTGAQIAPVNKNFLAVPNPKVVPRTGQGRYLQPAEWGNNFFVAKVHAVYSGVLVAKTDPDGPVYYWLFRRTKQRGRLNIAGIRHGLSVSLEEPIIREWRSKRVRIALQLIGT